MIPQFPPGSTIFISASRIYVKPKGKAAVPIEFSLKSNAKYAPKRK